MYVNAVRHLYACQASLLFPVYNGLITLFVGSSPSVLVFMAFFAFTLCKFMCAVPDELSIFLKIHMRQKCYFLQENRFSLKFELNCIISTRHENCSRNIRYIITQICAIVWTTVYS